MAQHVYVENYGRERFSEEFRGETITLNPGERIKMQRREAITFLAQMSPTLPTETRPPPKELRMVPISGGEEKKHVSNLDGRKFDTEEELDKHLASVSDQTVTQDEQGNIKRQA